MQIQQFLNASKPVKTLVYIWLASRCEYPRVSPISEAQGRGSFLAPQGRDDREQDGGARNRSSRRNRVDAPDAPRGAPPVRSTHRRTRRVRQFQQRVVQRVGEVLHVVSPVGRRLRLLFHGACARPDTIDGGRARIGRGFRSSPPRLIAPRAIRRSRRCGRKAPSTRKKSRKRRPPTKKRRRRRRPRKAIETHPRRALRRRARRRVGASRDAIDGV